MKHHLHKWFGFGSPPGTIDAKGSTDPIKLRSLGDVPGLYRSIDLERPTNSSRSALGLTLPDCPLVSVIMTAFNTAPWIETAMHSILGQTWSNLELIVVDDCSGDETLELVSAIARRDSRVRILSMKSNTGTYIAKNRGIGLAEGEVLTFMDSDDRALPNRIERQLHLLREPGLVATTCNYIRLTQDREIVLNRGLQERQSLISLMIKDRVVDEIGYFDSVRTSADDEYFERLRHVYGRSAHANVREPLYEALLRDNSLTTTPENSNHLSAENDSEFLSAARVEYVARYRAWYALLARDGKRPYIPFPIAQRPFDSPTALLNATHTLTEPCLLP